MTTTALTPREVEIVADLARGLTASESAAKHGLSYRTIDYHRANAMHKMGAKNAPHLVWLVDQAEIAKWKRAAGAA